MNKDNEIGDYLFDTPTKGTTICQYLRPYQSIKGPS